MRWADDAIVIAARPHGETSAIADLFTREHGRALGLVKGGRSRRIRPLLQTGNLLVADWRARLDSQLGVFTLELAEAVAARLLEDRLGLAGVAALASLLQILPERDPHPRLFQAARTCLQAAGSGAFIEQVIRFELRMLDELGFGLDLASCAVTGESRDLAFVSPKTGRAVTRQAGERWREKLLPLPGFATEKEGSRHLAASEVRDGLALTGYFLGHHVFGQAGRTLPWARDAFVMLACAQSSKEHEVRSPC